MQRSMPYGVESVLELDLPDESVVDYSQPTIAPLEDLFQATREALEAPLDFPPLEQALTPGDRVAVAVDRTTPQKQALLEHFLDWLEGCGVPLEALTFLQEQDDPAPLEAWLGGRANVLRHDPADREGLSYLAASQENQPIYFNRHLVDADVALSIGCLQPDSSLGYAGAEGALFPGFADEASQKRFRAPSSLTSSPHRKRRCSEAREAVWQLGSMCTLQALPGAGDHLSALLAGQYHAVADRGRELARQAWRRTFSQPVETIVAAVSGGPEQQTWENFARVLAAVSPAVEEGGAIVVCMDLRDPPGPALQCLAAAPEPHNAMGEILRLRSADAAAAVWLADLHEQAQVYLLSELDPDTVEQLGVGYVSEEAEISRLCRRRGSRMLLADAHRVELLPE